MATQAERRKRTQSQLLVAARHLFGTKGYTATTMDEVAAGAGVAKGALYHHFKTKRDLFEAVLLEVSAETAAAVQAGATEEDDLFDSMRSALRQFFDLCAAPEVCQILLRDGPAVLGWERWRAIDLQNFGGTVKATLSFGMAAKVLVQQPVEPLTHLLMGAISEAAISCAHEDSFALASAAYLESLDTLLRGLFDS